MFYQLDYGYISVWIDGFFGSHQQNKDECIDYEKSLSILSTILECDPRYEALDSSLERPQLSKSVIADIKQRFINAVNFHQITLYLSADEFEKQLHDLNESRAEAVVQDMVLFKCDEVIDGHFESKMFFLIDRLTGDAWSIDPFDVSNPEHLCPVLCHASSKQLREQELLLVKISADVMRSAMSNSPYKFTIGPDVDTPPEEGVLYEDWHPLLRVRNGAVIPFIYLNKIDAEPEEVLYLAGLGGLSSWAMCTPQYMRQFLKKYEVYDVEPQEWHSLFAIVLASGIAASALAERGTPNLVDASTYYEACAFRNAHLDLASNASHLLCQTINISDDVTLQAESVCISFLSSIAQKLSEKPELHNTIPVGIPNVQTECDTLLSILAEGENIAWVPTGQENGLLTTPDGFSDIAIDCLIITAELNGKKSLFRIPAYVNHQHLRRSRLTNFADALSGRELLALYCGFSKIGFGEDGNLLVSDPLNIQWEERYGRKSFRNMTPMITSNNETSTIFEFLGGFTELTHHYWPYGLLVKEGMPFSADATLSQSQSAFKEANAISDGLERELMKLGSDSLQISRIRRVIKQSWGLMDVDEAISDLFYSQFSEEGELVESTYPPNLVKIEFYAKFHLLLHRQMDDDLLSKGAM